MTDEIPQRRASDREPKPAARFADITLGTVIQVGAVLCGVVVWAVTSANHGEQAGRDLTSMQQNVSLQLTDLRAAVQSGLAEVRRQIDTLPDQRAKLEADDRRIGELERRLNDGDQRMGALERTAIEMRSDVNAMLRATNGPLSAQPQRGGKQQ